MRNWMCLYLACLMVVLPPSIFDSQSQAVAATATMLSTQPAATRAAGSQPMPVHKAETVDYDFGTVWTGDSVVHTLEVKNTSDRVLEIRRVNTSCGCTTTGRWDRQVQPGQVWKVEVTFNTAGRQGMVIKSVTVMTDDPDRPEIVLVLKGVIQPRFELSPTPSVNVGILQASSAVERNLPPGTHYWTAARGV